MATVEELLRRATRLLAMALAASERGDVEAAERLTAEASLCFDQATGLETPRPPRAEIDRPAAAQHQQQQQQQQPQQQQIPPAGEDLSWSDTRNGPPQSGASGGEVPKGTSGGGPESED